MGKSPTHTLSTGGTTPVLRYQSADEPEGRQLAKAASPSELSSISKKRAIASLQSAHAVLSSNGFPGRTQNSGALPQFGQASRAGTPFAGRSTTSRPEISSSQRMQWRSSVALRQGRVG